MIRSFSDSTALVRPAWDRVEATIIYRFVDGSRDGFVFDKEEQHECFNSPLYESPETQLNFEALQ